MADLFQLANASDLTGFIAEWASGFGLNPTNLTQSQNTSALAAYNAVRASPNPPAVNNTTATGGGGGGGTGGQYTPNSRAQGGLFSGETIVSRLLKASASTPQGAQDTWFGMNDVAETLTKMTSMVGIGMALKDVLKKAGDYAVEYVSQQTQLLETINQETGILNEMSDGLRESISQSIPRAAQLGISFQDMASSVTNMVKESGRFKLIDQTTIEQMALSSKFFTSMSEAMLTMPNFQEVSMGVYDAAKAIEKTGLSSTKLGLNARETVKILTANLDKMNQYGFKNGVDGLNRMVQKAQELRMNMDTVLGIADKVMDPEKALEMSANLQVIGGALSDFNDPIRMMYMSTNDVEGLNDALAKSAESLVTFNQEQGRFQIFGGDLRRGKAMAEQMGISYKELSNIAIQSAQRTQAANDLMMTGLNMKEEDREFITNMAQMKDGKMVIEVPESMRKSLGMDMTQTTLALDSLEEKTLQGIMVQKSGFEKLEMEDIAQRQYTVMSNINNNVNSILLQLVQSAGKIGSRAMGAVGVTRENKDELGGIVNDINKNIRGGIGDFSNKVIKVIGENPLSKFMPKSITPEPPKINPIVPQKETPKPEVKPVGVTAMANTRHTVDINIKSNSSFTDVISRELNKLPEFSKEIKDSFLEVFEPVA